jgi:hypothetical protein
MEHPVDIGDRTTLAVISVLRELGYGVLLPFGENTRYDVVIDDGCELRKVQCKTGRLRCGAVRWAVCSNYFHHPRPKYRSRDYRGQVDYFGVYCHETGAVYLVPIADLGNAKATASLRVEPARNGQKKLIRDAAQYEIGRVHLHAPDSVQRVAPLRRVDEVVA